MFAIGFRATRHLRVNPEFVGDPRSMPESIPSKQSSLSARTVCSTLLVSCLALPVLFVLPGCGSDPDSKVSGAGSSTGASPGTAGGMIFDPVGNGGMSSGGTGTGPGPATGGAGPYMLPPDYVRADIGGFKLGPAIDGAGGAPGTAGAGSSAGGSTSTCGTIILGVV